MSSENKTKGTRVYHAELAGHKASLPPNGTIVEFDEQGISVETLDLETLLEVVTVPGFTAVAEPEDLEDTEAITPPDTARALEQEKGDEADEAAPSVTADTPGVTETLAALGMGHLAAAMLIAAGAGTEPAASEPAEAKPEPSKPAKTEAEKEAEKAKRKQRDAERRAREKAEKEAVTNGTAGNAGGN